MPSRPMPRRRSRPSTSRRTGRYENSGTWSPPQRPVCWRDADWPRTAHRNPGCSRHRHAGDLGPNGEGLVAGEMELRGGVLAWAAGENVGDLIVGGKKPLHLPRRLEALHDPLSSSRWLVGILRPVIDGRRLQGGSRRDPDPCRDGIVNLSRGDRRFSNYIALWDARPA